MEHLQVQKTTDPPDSKYDAESTSAAESIIENLNETIARFSDECLFLKDKMTAEDTVIRIDHLLPLVCRNLSNYSSTQFCIPA